MKIFTQVKDSIISKEFYQSIPEKGSLSRGVKYLIKLSLLVSVVSLIFAAFYIPKVINSIQEATSSFTQSYPEDLVVTLKAGNISINKPEPFVVPLEGKLRDSLQQKNKKDKDGEKEYKDIENIITIDTTQPFSLEQFKNLKTMVWITKTEIIALKSNEGEIQIMPLSKFKDIEITKSWVLEKEVWFYKFLPLFIVLSVFALYIMFSVGHFFSSIFFVLFYGFVIYIMSKLSKKELTYRQSYIMGLYAITPVLILNAFSLYIKIPYHSLLDLLIIIGVVYINYFKDSSESTPEGTVEATQAPVNIETQ